MDNSNQSEVSSPKHWPLLTLAALAIAVGVFARFKGLGTWPLAIDEYYIARSVENVLRVGLPEYSCGGYYTRGIVFQYLAALLQLGGLSAELAPRLIAAVSSLLVLPAAYLLGRRLHSPTVGLLAVIVLALSVWEVEMGRFGRMYAPFQAVFVWYLLYFVRYTVDGDRRALLPMLALSVLGILVWEGGVLLALTNLMPPFLKRTDGTLSKADWTYLAATFALMVPIYLFGTNDLRMLADQPALPEDFTPDVSAGSHSFLMLRSLVVARPLWLAVGLVPLLAALPALRWVLQFRQRWIAALGLLAAVLAAALHQLAAASVILLLLLLMRLLDWRELFTRRALPLWIALIFFTGFWIAYGLLSAEWRADMQDNNLPALAQLAYQFVRFPDFVMEVVKPWSRAVPMLGLGLLTLIGVACVRIILESPPKLSPERALLFVLVILLLAASAAGTQRSETRYVFFLYPLAVLIALTAVTQLSRKIAPTLKLATFGGSAAALLLFVASEDFRPAHLMHIDSAEVNFRIGMRPGEPSHYHPREDIRSAGEWLTSNLPDSSIVVINAHPGVDFYYSSFDYTYIDRSNQRFAAYACKSGSVERWGNSALLDSPTDIKEILAKRKHIFIVASQYQLDALSTDLRQWNPRVTWTSLYSSVLIVELGSS